MVACVMSILLSLSLSLSSTSFVASFLINLSVRPWPLYFLAIISYGSEEENMREESKEDKRGSRRGKNLRPALLVNVPSIWYSKGWVGIRGFWHGVRRKSMTSSFVHQYTYSFRLETCNACVKESKKRDAYSNAKDKNRTWHNWG